MNALLFVGIVYVGETTLKWVIGDIEDGLSANITISFLIFSGDPMLTVSYIHRGIK